MWSDPSPVLFHRSGQHDGSVPVEPEMKVRRAHGRDDEAPAIIEVDEPCHLDVDTRCARLQSHLCEIIGEDFSRQCDGVWRAVTCR